ncbi:MAG TPA: ankyrin repeat domain-containing protein [Candidatus Eisenbacteria bacterium]|nr:ankyrin repeat domain-containing protein [Candidatus Eisenbacteria bacterium]
MRSLRIRSSASVSRALLALTLAGACGGEPVAPPARTPPTTLQAPAAPHRPLGMDEPRKAQPFTIDQRLLDAVRRGDRPTLERALELGASVQAKDDLQRGCVLLATKDAGDLALVQWLHEKGAPLDDPDVGGRTALGFAAEGGRLDLVRYLVEGGAAVNARDGQQRTPLFHAVLGDHADVMTFLLASGADVNVRDQFGDTPLIVACAKGFGATATLLLEHGADATLRDQEGRTARERSVPGVEPCLRAGPP